MRQESTLAPSRSVNQHYSFCLDNNPAKIPPVLGFLRERLLRLGLCDELRVNHLRIALSEALQNAIYHGNLEISSALRERDDDAYYRMAEERRGVPPYQHRSVYLRAQVSREAAIFTVRDEGPGFDVGRIPDPRDPANQEKASGRGLLLIRSFMDDVCFNETGNEITMVARWSPPTGPEKVASVTAAPDA